MDNKSIKVAKIINEYEVVINQGSDNGISKEDNFLVYNLGEELFDPDTKESLGHLEIICGRAKVKHAQDRLTTIISNVVEQRTGKRYIRKASNPSGGMFGALGEEEQDITPDTVPFNGVIEGSFVKKI